MWYRYKVVDYSDPRCPVVLYRTNNEHKAYKYCEKVSEAYSNVVVVDTQEGE